MSIKDRVAFEYKYKLFFYAAKFSNKDYFKQFKFQKSTKKAYLFLAADYGNLGDVAITYAQTKFLENQGYQVIDVPISRTAEGIWWAKSHIKMNDIVTIVGGGNMGDVYGEAETLRQIVIKQFPNNKIISFPQTFDFSKNFIGNRLLKKSVSIYSKHKDLTIVAREKLSYELMKQNFSKNKVILTPDIVLTLKNITTQLPRDGVLLCLRNDIEKSIDSNITDETIKCLMNEFGQKITYRDTFIEKYKMSLQERDESLKDIWTAFSKSELVVTDRLHGMIFAYITHTPCIVFQNTNHKIKGSYEWLKHQSNILLVDKFDPNELKIFLENFRSMSSINFNLEESFNPLVEILKIEKV